MPQCKNETTMIMGNLTMKHAKLREYGPAYIWLS